MDLRTLLNKLDKLESHQVLMESNTIREEILSTELQLLKESYSALMERVHKKELDALRDVNDEELRKSKLAALASKHGYPGLFDPRNGKWVDNQGNYAWFGPYKDEVEKMELDGLVPPEAHTSAFWGLMGKDKAEAIKASTANASRFELIDGADEIIDKANQSKPAMDEAIVRGSLARALTEDFGYSSNYIVEAISTTEHLKLKAYIEKLNSPEYKDDKEVRDVIFKYQEYVKYRDLLIAKIKEALARFKSKVTPAPKAVEPVAGGLQPDANQSSAEVERLKRQNAGLNESRGVLKEEFYIVPHKDKTASVVHFYLDESGNVVGYVVTEDVEALGRGALDGLTFGWGDNAVAGIISMYKGTPYGEELIRQIRASEAAKKRAPVWYYGGMIAGGAGWGGTSLVGNLAAAGINVASDMVREPVNDKIIKQYKADQANKLKKVQNTVGAEPTGVPDAKTVSAVKTKAAPVKANEPAEKSSGEMSDVFAAFGVKDMNGLFVALKSQGVRTMDQLGTAVGKALNIEPMTPVAQAGAPKVAESIIYSSMSESERMAYLRNRLNNIEQPAQLDEAIPGLGTGIKTGLEWLFGGAARLLGHTPAVVIKGLEGIEKVLGKGVTELALPSGVGTATKIWKLETTGANAGKWSTAGRTRGTRVFKTAEEIADDLKNALHSGFKPRARPGQPALPSAPPQGWVNPGSEIASAELNGAKYIKDADGKWYMKNASTGVHMPVTDAAILRTLEQGAVKTGMLGQLAAKYPKLAAGFKGVGSILKFGWNNKWWIALAAIIAAGYWAWANKPEEPVPPEVPPVSDQQVDPEGIPIGPGGPGGETAPKPDKDGNCPTGWKPSADGKSCEKVGGSNGVTQQISPEARQEAGNIRKLLQQLKDMYPADKETRDLEAEVEDALKGIPQSSQEVDTKAKPNNRYNF